MCFEMLLVECVGGRRGGNTHMGFAVYRMEIVISSVTADPLQWSRVPLCIPCIPRGVCPKQREAHGGVDRHRGGDGALQEGWTETAHRGSRRQSPPVVRRFSYRKHHHHHPPTHPPPQGITTLFLNLHLSFVIFLREKLGGFRHQR